MDAKDLLLDALEKRGAAYRQNLKLCRDEFSKKAIHDLRTSIRRLLAILDVAAFVTSGSRVEKLSGRLKEQLDGLDDLRDTQVLLDEISEKISTLPELEPFQDHLEKLEKRKQRKAEEYVQDIKPGGVNKRFVKVYEKVEELPPEELHGKLPQAVDEAYLTVIQRYGEVSRTQPITIHRLRIAFKKFRYMVESIYPCLPNYPETMLEDMHDYQTQMGRIHDLQVFLAALNEFAEASNLYDPQSVRRFYERLLAETLSTYLKNKHRVTTYWRANPLKTFPWEADQKRKDH